ncbi:hypothetical protein C4585_02575 [Candidatus Parcubacteria bacterium]|nr:MAG: hypothetical protein C4585_02575 [Candidatus Parcubacteria bacterium]
MKIQKSQKFSHQHSRKFGRIEKQILQELSFGDLLFGYLLSFGSTGRMFKLARQRAMDRYRRRQAIQRLKEFGYIRSCGDTFSITSAGRKIIEGSIERTLQSLKTKKWDHKWRIAIFDIPEKQAFLRSRVRRVLKRAGFVQLQQSVWVFPHECEELVQLIKQESKLSEYILYGVLERIEDEKRLKRIFDLEK